MVKELEDESLPENGKTNRLLLLLPYLLKPITIKKKSSGYWRPSKVEVAEGFIIHIKTIGELQNTLESRKTKLGSFGLTLQPIPIIVGESLDLINSAYVAVDDTLYEVNTAIKALDICFKTIHALHSLYASESEQTNEEAVSITTPYPVAIYEVSPLLEHNCWANCYKSIDSQGVLRIIAGVAIPEGQRLFICYTNPLWTTFNRQRYLEKKKFLKCKCERCMDVTENLTYISAVNCVVKNCLGVLLPKTFVTPSPLWECNKCYMSVSQYHVSALLHRLWKEYITIKSHNNCDDMKMYLGNNKKIVPEYHSYIIESKLASLSMLGGITPVNMQKISLEDVMLKTSFCHQLIELLKKIAPAEKRIMGYVYYNLELSLEEMYRRRILSGDTDVNDSIFCVKTFKYILDDVVKYLKYESTIEMEGKICSKAIRKLTGLDLVLLELQPELRSEFDRMFNAFLKY